MRLSRPAAVALAGTLALTLAGCGDDGEEPQTPAATTAESTTSDATTDDATTDDATTGDAGATDTSTTDDDGATATSTGDGDATSGTAGTTGGATDPLTVLEAVVGAAEAEAGGTAYQVDDEDDDDSWEVDVATEDRSVEVTVTPDGQVVGTEEDDLDDDDRRGLEAATTTVLDAAGVALDEVDGTLDDIELEEEDGTFAWEVTIDTAGDDDVEVYVDVATGAVLRVDRD